MMNQSSDSIIVLSSHFKVAELSFILDLVFYESKDEYSPSGAFLRNKTKSHKNASYMWKIWKTRRIK